jgi:hypothetical protein
MGSKLALPDARHAVEHLDRPSCEPDGEGFNFSSSSFD